MKELDIELVIAKGIEKHPGVKPRIISDNGPQFIAKDFKEFVREYTDERANKPLLPSEQWKARALAWLSQGRVHSPRLPSNQRGGREANRELCDLLQYCSSTKCDWLHNARRLPSGSQRGDRPRTRPQVGSGTQTATRKTSCCKTSCLVESK